MAYTPQTWVDHSLATPLNAARMAHLETGISDAHTLIAGLGAGGQASTVAGLETVASNTSLAEKQTVGGRNYTRIQGARAGGQLAGKVVQFFEQGIVPVHGDVNLSGAVGVYCSPGCELQQTKIPTSGNDSAYGLRVQGTWHATKRTLTSSTAIGARTITVNDVTGMARGSAIAIWDTASLIRSGKYAAGESATVLNVSGTTLTLSAPLERAYNSATAQVLLYYPHNPFVALNYNISHADPVNAGEYYHDLMRFELADDVRVLGGNVGPGPARGIHLAGVRGAVIDGAYIHDLLDGTYGGVAHLGYGVEAAFTSCDVTVTEATLVERVRHALTTNSNVDMCGNPAFFGGNTIGDPRRVRFAARVRETTSTAVDTHECGLDVDIIPNIGHAGVAGDAAVNGDPSTGSLPLGINIRCDRARVLGGVVHSGPAGGIQVDHSTQTHAAPTRVAILGTKIIESGGGNGTQYALDIVGRTAGAVSVQLDAEIIGATRPVNLLTRNVTGKLRIDAGGRTGLGTAIRMAGTLTGAGPVDLRGTWIDPAYSTFVNLGAEPAGNHRVQQETDTRVSRKWTGVAWPERAGRYLIPAGHAYFWGAPGGTTDPADITTGDVVERVTGVLTATRRGTLVVESGAVPMPLPFTGRLTRVDAAVGTPPTGGPVVLDVNIGGSSVFTSGARPTIAVGQSSDTATPDSAAATFTAGQLITVDVDSVGYSEPTFVNTGGASATALSVTYTPAPPAGQEWALNDVVLFSLKVVRGATITPPSGCTEIGVGIDNTGANAWAHKMYWYRCPDTIPTSFQFAQSISGFISVSGTVYRNTRLTGSPINAFSVNTPAFASTFTSPSLTTTVPGCRLVQTIQVDVSRTVGAWAAGLTERSTRVADGVQAASGASGTKQGSFSDGSSITSAYLVALEPGLSGQAAGADLTMALLYDLG